MKALYGLRSDQSSPVIIRSLQIRTCTNLKTGQLPYSHVRQQRKSASLCWLLLLGTFQIETGTVEIILLPGFHYYVTGCRVAG